MRILIAPGRGALSAQVARELIEADSGTSVDSGTDRLILPIGAVGPEAAEGRMAEAVATAVATLGGLDGLVVIADAAMHDPEFTCAPDAWDAVIAANTRAVWLLIKVAHPYLRANTGAVAVVVPAAALVPDPQDLAGGASLAATVLMARVYAQELGRDGVRVNIVVAAAHEVAGAAAAALFLIGAKAGYISGQVLTVDDGRLDHAAHVAFAGPR